jgi:hypothetical protein
MFTVSIVYLYYFTAQFDIFTLAESTAFFKRVAKKSNFASRGCIFYDKECNF